MQRQSFITLALMAATLGVAGCHAEQQPSPQKAQSAPASDYTAWWKTEGSPAEAAGKAIAAATRALPGWAQLPPAQAASVKAGEALFKDKGCVACHSFGGGDKVGPDLLGVTHRVSPEWATAFMADPAPMLESDPHAKQMLGQYLVKMPNLHLTAAQLDALRDYMRQQDQRPAAGHR